MFGSIGREGTCAIFLKTQKNPRPWIFPSTEAISQKLMAWFGQNDLGSKVT